MNAIDTPSLKRDDASALIGDIERLELIFEGWDETARGAAIAYRRSIEALHGEALRRLVKALKTSPEALAAMKAAVSDEVVYAVLRRHDIVKPSLTERVETALEGIRPMLASHGGDVELVAIMPPAIQVRFLGACDGCPASALTFHAGVKKAVEDACPEITDIVQVKGMSSGPNEDSVRFVSPFALASSNAWEYAAKLADIPEGGIRPLELAGEKVILARRGGIVSCFQNACAHLGMEIDNGEIDNGIITCPYHQFRYDLATGECLTAPTVQLQAHAVRIVGNRVEVRLSK